MECIGLVTNKEQCTGCGACMAVCPTGAISMESDSCGFLYPKIDETACIRCGKCVKTCQALSQLYEKTEKKAYAARGCSDALVKRSASGGVFATLAHSCVQDGFLIAGAVMQWENGGVNVEHILSEKADDIPRMQGSKYVQSNAWKSYAGVVKAVGAGEKVLFAGTPCQVAAVCQITGNPENLITVDLICHGVPPVQMLNDYIRILSERFGGTVEDLIFRDKSCGKDFCARVGIRRGRKKKHYLVQSRFLSYYKFFLEGAIYRESCYSCPYANMERISDITIGDFWGVEKFHNQDMERDCVGTQKDWSCILVNSEKGDRFLKEYGRDLRLYLSRPEWIAENNQQLNQASEKPPDRIEVLKAYRTGGFQTVEKEFIRKNGGLLRFTYRMARNIYRNRINAIHNKVEYED